MTKQEAKDKVNRILAANTKFIETHRFGYGENHLNIKTFTEDLEDFIDKYWK